MQHSLSAILRSHSSTSSSLGTVSPIFVVVRGIIREERKEIGTRSRWKKNENKLETKSAGPRSASLLARLFSYTEWRQRGEHTLYRSTTALARWSGAWSVVSAYSTHSTRLVCVCGDPAGPVFWPRLTRALGACSPRSHPSGHALFHPGERIVCLGLEVGRPIIINQPQLSIINRSRYSANDWPACSIVTDLPPRWI